MSTNIESVLVWSAEVVDVTACRRVLTTSNGFVNVAAI